MSFARQRIPHSYFIIFNSVRAATRRRVSTTTIPSATRRLALTFDVFRIRGRSRLLDHGVNDLYLPDSHTFIVSAESNRISSVPEVVDDFRRGCETGGFRWRVHRKTGRPTGEEEEEDREARRFLWTSGCVLLAEGAVCTPALRLRIGNASIERNPAVVENSLRGIGLSHGRARRRGGGQRRSSSRQ